MSSETVQKSDSRFSILQGVLPIDREKVPLDIIAGITLAALAIPEVMGYTQIAGMPVVTGLYTILIPTALFALFGSSRHLVVGADSATAAIMAAGLAGLAATASPEYVAYAGILALMAAVFLILARLINLGFLADFLSRTVLIGFLTGVGIQVAIGQIPGMLGIPGGGLGPVQDLITDLKQIPETNLYTLAVSVAVLVIIVGGRRINKKIPGALIAVIGMIVISYLVDLSSYDVAVLGTVPGGLPKIGIPTGATLNSSIIYQLFGIAFSMFIVILAQSAATSRAYATRYGESFSENVDLVGLGLANIGATLSGTFVVNGSPTKTQMVDSAGGRSQLATLTMSVIVLIVLLFLTKPLAYMPEAVLSSVVFLIGIELVDAKGMRKIFTERPVEFWVAAITAAVVVFVGVEQGILLAIVLSILIHTRHGYKPKNALLSTDSSGKQHVLPVSSHAQVIPGLMIYRFHHSMYYANAENFSQEVIELVDSAESPVSWFCIDTTAVDDVDFSAAATLREIYDTLKEKGVRLVFAEVGEDIRKELDLSDVTDLVGRDAFYESAADVEDAFRAEAGVSES
ncbi:MAG: SulP family inorganic anion transporter [Candidatus Promineifilaceae bacterium]